MNRFSIRDIEHLTGIKAHTLRIWEQRYGIILSKRKDSNHRYYDNNDLKYLLRIARLYHNGVKISRIAAMDEATICKEAMQIVSSANYYENYINRLSEAMIDFDQQQFEEIFNAVLLHAGFEQCILQLIYPYLERVGLLWLTNHIIPAQEHFSSNLIRQKIMVAIDGLEPSTKTSPHYLLFLPEGEFHEIPLLFIWYLLKKSGKKVTYFGANIALEEIATYMKVAKPTHLFTHVITNFTEMNMERYGLTLQSRFPKLQIVLSGPQNQYITSALPENITVLRSMDDIVRYAASS